MNTLYTIETDNNLTLLTLLKYLWKELGKKKLKIDKLGISHYTHHEETSGFVVWVWLLNHCKDPLESWFVPLLCQSGPVGQARGLSRQIWLGMNNMDLSEWMNGWIFGVDGDILYFWFACYWLKDLVEYTDWWMDGWMAKGWVRNVRCDVIFVKQYFGLA